MRKCGIFWYEQYNKKTIRCNGEGGNFTCGCIFSIHKRTLFSLLFLLSSSHAVFYNFPTDHLCAKQHHVQLANVIPRRQQCVLEGIIFQLRSLPVQKNIKQKGLIWRENFCIRNTGENF